MSLHFKIGEKVFLKSRTPNLFLVLQRKDNFVQVEDTKTQFKMFVKPNEIVTIKAEKDRKAEIEKLLRQNTLSGCIILDRDDVEELEEELGFIDSRLKGL